MVCVCTNKVVQIAGRFLEIVLRWGLKSNWNGWWSSIWFCIFMFSVEKNMKLGDLFVGANQNVVIDLIVKCSAVMATANGAANSANTDNLGETGQVQQ